jgi:hypothetical protein
LDPGDGDRREAGVARELRELVVRVEVAACRERIRGGRGALRLGRGRADRDAATVRIEDAAHLPERVDRLREEEEGCDGRDRRELAVAERQVVGFAADGERLRKPHHFAAVVDTLDGAAGRVARVPEEDAAAATDVEQPVVRLQLQRLEHRRPHEVVHVGRAVRGPRRATVRPTGNPVGHAVDPPLADALQRPHARQCPGRPRPVPGTGRVWSRRPSGPCRP